MIQLLLSPAKTMARKEPKKPLFQKTTQPHFLDIAKELAFEVGQFSAEELEEALKTSRKIATQAREDFRNFGLPDTPLMSAIEAYTGIVFKYLNPHKMSPEGLQRLSEHLLMTSFLYGLVRPTDAISPYRLEGSVMLPNHAPEGVFKFWRDKLTPLLAKQIEKHEGKLLYLASEEMKGLFHWREEIEAKYEVIYPEFKVDKDGKRKQIVVYTKMLRGTMCRYAAENNFMGTADEMLAFAESIEAKLEVDGNLYTYIL